MGTIHWVLVEPRKPDDREDLAMVYMTADLTVMYSERDGKLYKTQGGHWFRGTVEA